MAGLTKDEYLLRMLSKIRHKQWENYIVNRIVHRLNDPEIEFVCQQFIARPGGHALADLYFPQFNMSLEVDEPQHKSVSHALADRARTLDIIAAIGCDERRIGVSRPSGALKTLDEINAEVDVLIDELRRRKSESGDAFVRWDYDTQFDPAMYIKRGFIDARQNVAFRTHRDALRCFGYAKGHYQRAGWTIPGTKKGVWFPKLYLNDEWDNSRSEDGECICEKYLGSDPKHLNRVERVDTRFVFAHDRDALGLVLYRFVGEFKKDTEKSGGPTDVFQRVALRVDLRPFLKQFSTVENE